MFLKSKDITVVRKGGSTLQFPDIEVGHDDSVLLLGASGAGKTTFLSVLAGLLRPNAGQVLVDGGDFYAISSSKRDQERGQKFGFIFQTLHLLPSLTLRQNIALAADMANVPLQNERLEHLLKTLGLVDKADRKPDALSQGEQQRAAIARAVLLRPQIIMADEPTSALDDDNANSVMDLLEAQAKESGAALLVATHDNRIKGRFKTIINLESQVREAA